MDLEYSTAVDVQESFNKFKKTKIVILETIDRLWNKNLYKQLELHLRSEVF